MVDHLNEDEGASDRGRVKSRTGKTLDSISCSTRCSTHASTLSTILAWPVTLHDERGGEVRLNEVIVANTQATGLQTVITRDRVKVAAAPEAFALLGNQPNPFNPNTQITYEVPQQSHITLTVFNLLGQEVIRLVDQVQTPGRYVVTWNARNANGLSVSSGVYMYRLVTSAGAVDTKRMTLLK